NGFRLIGRSENGPQENVSVVDVDWQGDVIAANYVGVSAPGSAVPFSVGGDDRLEAEETADGGFLIMTALQDYQPTGAQAGTLVMKLDAAGSTVFTYVYTGLTGMKAIAETDDGGFVIGGEGEGMLTTGKMASLYKMDVLGMPEWARGHGICRNNIVGDVDQAPDGGYFVTGLVEDFDTVSNVATRNLMLYRMDSLGFTGCFDSLDATYSMSDALPLWESDSLDVFNVNMSVFPMPWSAVVGLKGISECPAVRDSCEAILLSTVAEEGEMEMQLVPNPASEGVEIQLKGVFAYPLHVEVWDVLGKKRMDWVWEEGKEKVLGLERFAAGMYWVRIEDEGGKVMTKRLIKR
ncbi:MAG: T9SS type A sorting domain-containing protein, partial [Bacteroidota bacterium]